MRGVVDVREWRNVLAELKESNDRQDDDMEPEVFLMLRFSYTHLKDSALQQCFLYCSLFPEDFEVERNDLIERGRNSIRDVALQILQESSSIIVKAGAQLRELWKVDRESCQKLAIYNCNVVMSLCDVSSSIRYAAELERIDLSHCNSMESLVSSSWLCSSPLPFPSCFYLVELQVRLFVMLLGVHNYPVDLKLVL
ncbi:hypothetical protein Peur_071100 [Populus x canadensis]